MVSERTPADLGMPDYDEAYNAARRLQAQMASERDWSMAHPAIHWTVQRLDRWIWRRSGESDCRRQFRAQYAKAIQFARDGGKFPEPPKLLPRRPDFIHPGKGATAKSHIAQMRHELGMDL